MLWSLLTPALRCSCSPTQLVVFIIQQESVEYSIYLFSYVINIESVH